MNAIAFGKLNPDRAKRLALRSAGASSLPLGSI
jgi:hypothetical protein